MFYSVFVCIFFFKQKTAYEMRISDWSSDVCSSDLEPPRQEELERPVTSSDEGTLRHVAECLLERARIEIMRLEDGERHQRLLPILGWLSAEIGRASCRERVSQYV